MKEKGKYDELIETNGIKVIVDGRSMMYILGTEIDYKEDEISSEFTFNNPLVINIR